MKKLRNDTTSKAQTIIFPQHFTIRVRLRDISGLVVEIHVMINPKRRKDEGRASESHRRQVNHSYLDGCQQASTDQGRESHIRSRVPFVPFNKRRTHKKRQPSQEQADRVGQEHDRALPYKDHLPPWFPFPDPIAAAHGVRARSTRSHLRKYQGQEPTHARHLPLRPAELRRRFLQQLQHRGPLRREQYAEDREQEARVPERGGEPVCVDDGAPGEGADGGGGYDGALVRC